MGEAGEERGKGGRNGEGEGETRNNRGCFPEGTFAQLYTYKQDPVRTERDN